MQKSGGTTNIKQLAQALGLSTSTVSRALNGYTDVNEQTRLRVQEMAAALAKRVESAPNRVQRAFELCFHRRPDAREVALAEDFLQKAPGDDSKRLSAFCQALLCSAEFRFAD